MKYLSNWISIIKSMLISVALIVPFISPLTAYAADPYTNTTILFSDQNSNTIYGIDPDGSGLVNIGQGREPKFSPNGSQIVYIATNQDPNAPCAGGSSVFTMNSDGSHLRNLTPNACDTQYPVWSPDGNSIAFQSYDLSQSSYVVSIMSKLGTNQQSLTQGDGTVS